MKLWLPVLFFGAFLNAAGLTAKEKMPGIKDLYAMALQQDPLWQAAQKEREAEIEQQNIARADLLPDLRLNYQNTPYNNQESSGPQSVYSKTQQVTTNRRYASYNGSLTLTQPLFDYGAWARFKASVEQGQMADERLREKGMDLAIRLINHYLDAGLAQQKILISESQEKALKEQYKLNLRLLEAGEGTRTEVLETQARLRLAKTEMIALQDELYAAQRELAAMIGLAPANLDRIKNRLISSFTPQRLIPENYEDWQTLTLKQSATITEARHKVLATRREAQAQYGEFMPLVSLYASRSLSKSATNSSIDQRYETGSIGIQVNVPLYSGGRSTASTKQASARLGQSQYLLENIIRTTLNELHKTWRQCSGVQDRLKAYSLAVESAQLQLAATQKGVAAGQRINLDVLDAERLLYSTRLDLVMEKYNYIRSWLMLHYYSGKLSQEVIETIDSYFQ